MAAQTLRPHILADMTRTEEPTPSEEVVSLPPETFTLNSLRDGRLRVVEPIGGFAYV